jgi:hypothetical protein
VGVRVSAATPDLDLSELQSGMPALTPAMGAVLKEAAAVCLSDNGHPIPVPLHQKRSSGSLLLQWPPATDAMKRTYNDMQRTTELGACGIAILVVRKESGLTVVEQSRKGTGFDYWLGPDDDESLPFAKKARLEVSGILKGSNSQFNYRVKQKLEQTKASDSSRLEAYAVVVEFGRPVVEVGKR